MKMGQFVRIIIVSRKNAHHFLVDQKWLIHNHHWSKWHLSSFHFYWEDQPLRTSDHTSRPKGHKCIHLLKLHLSRFFLSKLSIKRNKQTHTQWLNQINMSLVHALHHLLWTSFQKLYLNQKGIVQKVCNYKFYVRKRCLLHPILLLFYCFKGWSNHNL